MYNYAFYSMLLKTLSEKETVDFITLEKGLYVESRRMAPQRCPRPGFGLKDYYKEQVLCLLVNISVLNVFRVLAHLYWLYTKNKRRMYFS